MNKKQKNKLKIFGLALSLTVADLLIPDPLPVLDEVVLGLWTTVAGVDLISSSKGGKKK